MAITLLPAPTPFSTIPMLNQNTDATMDAAGESCAVIGYARLEAGSGTKTLSAAGGGSIVIFPAGTITFANGASTFDVGVQDLSGGLEDGTYDVYGTLTGGTDTIVADTILDVPMETGTKDIAHGQLIAIVHTLSARGGADTISLNRFTAISSAGGASVLPYGSADTGSLAKSTLFPLAMIRFDDGTLGWIDGGPLSANYVTLPSFTFGTGSNPDEYLFGFRSPGPISTCGAEIRVNNVATTDDLEVILYSAPFSATPVAERTCVIDADELGSSVGGLRAFWANFTCAANTDYGIGIRPTTANTISLLYYDLLTGFDDLKRSMCLPTLTVCGRQNQSGAFSVVQTYYAPLMSLLVGGIDDGAGAGGGLLTHPGMAGGMRG